MNAMQLLAVAVGGAGGAVARFCTVNALGTAWGRSFPYGTLVVNVTGSLLMGLLLALLLERGLLGEPWRAGLMAGVLGGFTTFSAFAAETLVLIEQQRPGAALANAAVHLILCLLAVAAGAWAGRHL